MNTTRRELISLLTVAGSVGMLRFRERTPEAHEQAQEPAANDPVKTFRGYVARYMESYKPDKHKMVTKDEKRPASECKECTGGWVKRYFEPNEDYSIDVRRTDSLVSPYIGVCEFTLTLQMTAYHA